MLASILEIVPLFFRQKMSANFYSASGFESNYECEIEIGLK